MSEKITELDNPSRIGDFHFERRLASNRLPKCFSDDLQRTLNNESNILIGAVLVLGQPANYANNALRRNPHIQ